MNNFEHLGPLTLLVGTWGGDKGSDTSPEPDGTEKNTYRETVTYTPIGDVDNAEEQELVGVYYHQIVHRIRDNKHLHDQCGYWMWDKVNDLVIHTLAIPRGVSVVLEGKAEKTENGWAFKLRGRDREGHIAQSVFMREKALTTTMSMSLELEENKLVYDLDMDLEIYGRSFDHLDHAELTKQRDT
ncbi:MAG: heme-binding beta-barrel domain-containing protein [Oleiphilaceae bacterium]|nr:heme-binding beta-barrel domain-containing protein [Oleiphilaceae bacterium]